jgi:3-isopropylmalate/(R)-2-methylmalate dehydratase large subunit
LLQKRPRNMKVEVTGALPFGTTAKDVALAIVGKLGASGAIGHVIEFCGDTSRPARRCARVGMH